MLSAAAVEVIAPAANAVVNAPEVDEAVEAAAAFHAEEVPDDPHAHLRRLAARGTRPPLTNRELSLPVFMGEVKDALDSGIRLNDTLHGKLVEQIYNHFHKKGHWYVVFFFKDPVLVKGDRFLQSYL